MSDSYEDYFQPRFTDTAPSVAALQARIAELEAQLNLPKWDTRLSLLPNYLKRVQMTVDFQNMTLRYQMNDDNIQPWQFGTLDGDVLSPMFAAVGLRLRWCADVECYALDEICQ